MLCIINVNQKYDHKYIIFWDWDAAQIYLMGMNVNYKNYKDIMCNLEFLKVLLLY